MEYAVSESLLHSSESFFALRLLCDESVSYFPFRNDEYKVSAVSRLISVLITYNFP
jgi:hypothetical protein